MAAALYQGQCYADAVSAASAQCADSSRVVDAGGVVQCTAVGGTPLQPSLLMRLTKPDATTATYSVAFVHRECDQFEPYADMLQLWSVAIPAILGVVLIREFILRYLRPQ